VAENSKRSGFDHLVIVAQSLAEGVAYVQEHLGVVIPKGGVHEYMGTHNHVMQLGADCYLEVIAINPSARGPVHPRWFDMDSPLLRDRISRGPVLLTWIVNVPTHDMLEKLDSELWGSPLAMSRDSYEWSFSLREDGALPAGGCIPTPIWWKSNPPVLAMPSVGCSICSIVLRHPKPKWLAAKLTLLSALNVYNLEIDIQESTVPGFTAVIETPSGIRELKAF